MTIKIDLCEPHCVKFYVNLLHSKLLDFLYMSYLWQYGQSQI